MNGLAELWLGGLSIIGLCVIGYLVILGLIVATDLAEQWLEKRDERTQ